MSEEIKEYDYVIVGAGGGQKMTFSLNKIQPDSKIALIEKGPMGGTCLNRGCIPSKMLIHVANLLEHAKESAKFNLSIEGASPHFGELTERVTKTVTHDSDHYREELSSRKNVDLYNQLGSAVFVGERTLEIGGKIKVKGKRVILGTGARPLIPPIPGLKDVPYITSTEALRLKEQPKKMIIIGGGYIGVEMAHFFGTMGTELHTFTILPMVAMEDEDIINEFTKEFSEKYDTHIGVGPKKVVYNEETKMFKIWWDEDGKEHEMEADQLLVAAGVRPNYEELELEKGGIEVSPKGFIKVDDHLRTTAEGVWAFGDVVGTTVFAQTPGNYMFRHSANYEVEYLLSQFLSEEDVGGISYLGMPHAIFTSPQIAGVGMTEKQCQDEGIEYVKSANNYCQSAMGMAIMPKCGFVKFLVEKKTRKILGCHIMGYEASVMIHEVIPFVRMEKKLDDLLNMIHIHPALNEIVRNAARKARDALVAAGEKIPLLLSVQ